MVDMFFVGPMTVTHVLDPCTIGRAGVSIDPLSFQDPRITANGKMCKTGGNGLLHRC